MKKIIVVLASLVILTATYTVAQVPGTLSYQGILLDANGVPMPDKVSGYQVTFYFYNVETGGTALEVRGPFTVVTKKGLFTLVLGDGTSGNAALPATFGDQQLWMGIKIDADLELSPRVKFTSVPYAYRSENANKATLASGIEAGKVVQGINGFKDAVTITGSSGVTVNSNGNNIDIAGPSNIVNSVNSKTGAVTISAGSNITLVPSGNDLQISGPANIVNRVNNISGDVTIAAGANVTVNNAGNTVTINATASGGNVSGTSTSGYVSFWNGLSSIGGNPNLFWDNTNSRLGIGTATPAQKLDVNGTVNATAFTGDASALTSLNATNISSGTLSDARLSAHLFDLSDGTLTGSKVGSGISASNITTGTLSGSFIGSGINAANLSGTATLNSLNVGSSSLFSVNSSGNITKLNSLTYSFPSIQGVAGTHLTNDGTGTLTWSPLDSDLLDLADGSLTGSTVGTGISATNITTGTLPNAVLDADLQDLADGSLSGTLVGTGVSATNVTTGTLPNAVLDAELQDLADGSLSGSLVGMGINASNISTGTLADARLETNVDVAGTLTTVGGATIGGTITGNGSGISSINATNISSGTIADARLETNVDVAGTLTTVGGATIGGTITGNGSGISSINATNISSGTISDVRLETNVDVAGAITTVNGLHVGGASAPGVDNLEVDGYTKLGSGGPTIQMKKITGTTDPTQGNEVVISHGLTVSKIISITAMVESTAGVTYIPAGFKFAAQFEFYVYLSGANVRVATVSANSANVVNKPFRILITYEQ